MRITGTYETLGSLNYFIPHPLPPADPPLAVGGKTMELYGEASFALGQLNEMAIKLPDANQFIKAYVIKEAILSSEIEGIHTTLVEVFSTSLEGGIKPAKDTQLVLNYTLALGSALEMLQVQNLPLVNRVILKSHEVLMSVGEGDKAAPGQFRQQSVRVGSLVPPPATKVPDLMSRLEKYINEEVGVPLGLPPLIRAGLAHVQFETIHPFLDGNGRIGRLLIVLMLINDSLLKLPILYPSYYFKKNRAEYYQRLDSVRTSGDFEGWIDYYLKAIRDSAIDAHIRAKDIERLAEQLQTRVMQDEGFAKIRETASAAVKFLFSHPVTNVAEMSQKLDRAYNTVQNILKELMHHGLVSETVINKRNRLYRFEPYLALLEKEYQHEPN